MLKIGIRKHFITNKLLVYIHITLKMVHKISVNFSNSVRECSVNLDIFSKTHREISCFSPCRAFPLVTGFHYPSTRPVLTGVRFH